MPVDDHNSGSNAAIPEALEMLKQLGGQRGIHLDLGAGLASVAAQVQTAELTYVATSDDETVLAGLRANGFEAHAANLLHANDLLPAIARLRNGRELASISLIGALDLLPSSGVLDAIRRAVEGTAAPLVLDAANVASTDRLLGLIAAREGRTGAHHTELSLRASTSTAGWREVVRSDLRANSDGHSHPDSIALSSRTTLNQFLRKLHQGTGATAGITRFVRAYLPAQRRTPRAAANSTRPFLSVLMRTQGLRTGTLRDAMLALAAQSCDDFELLILPHKVPKEQLAKLEAIVAEHTQAVRAKIRVLPVDHGGRAAPLNAGFAKARGEYVSVLDDDDVVFGHWVESFKKAAAHGAGTLLRAIAVEQDIESRSWPHGPGYRTLSGFRKTFPAEYDLYAHLTQNYSPLHSLAFPAAFFHELGEHFDEELSTCEDWDYEMRCALTCGVTPIREYTAIYRMWKSGASSYTVHPKEQWAMNEQRIVARLNAQPHIFPAGTVELIRKQQAWIRKLEKDVAELQQALSGPVDPSRRLPVPPPGTERPVRYDVADEINRVFKKLPAVHPLLKSSLAKLTRR